MPVCGFQPSTSQIGASWTEPDPDLPLSALSQVVSSALWRAVRDAGAAEYLVQLSDPAPGERYALG